MNKSIEAQSSQEIYFDDLLLTRTGNGQKPLEKAKQICIAYLKKNPAGQNFFLATGAIYFLSGKTKEAATCLDEALIRAPQSPMIIYNYAVMLMAQKKYGLALLLMMRFVALNPDHSRAYWHIGNILSKTGDMDGSLAAFDKALESDPKDIYAWNDKGNALKEMGRLREAAACYKQALIIRPDYNISIIGLGFIHFLQNDLNGAEALYKLALSNNPKDPDALSNLSTVQRVRGDLNGAILNCQKALALNPISPDVLNNLGNALTDARRLEEAIDAYRAYLRIEPNDADVHKNLSLALLTLGRFPEGWLEYEWRWKSRQHMHRPRDFAQPKWNGEAGNHRTILITAEQGFGDTLQFCRYAPLLKERGFHVIMAVQPPLKRLLHSLDGVDKVMSTESNDLPVFDFHCLMMSLPKAFKTSAETIPAKIPYLSPDPLDVAKWRDRVAALSSDALKVGLVWAGSSRRYSPDAISIDQKRSVSPEVFAPLMKVPNALFFSLQKEGTPAPKNFHLIDWMMDCSDFADTAALIMNLDLVISVDTAVAHLAGALGKPVWLMDRFNSCWRWLAGRDDSPWYPTLRLFRQKELGDWDEVAMRIRAALVERC